ISRSGDGHRDSVDSLLRWNHRSERRLAPGRFLPAAERGGLMVDIDRWVLDRACHCLATRESAGEAPVPLCINLSSASLLDAGLPGVVKAQLTRYRVPPDRLEVEITESAAMGDLGLAASVVEQLQKIGVRVALDDLGTGYSSLVHLRELRADRLKIDRSFVRAEDPFGRAIAAAIAALGRSLGRDVGAAGVETGDALALCRGQGIGLVQGWYLHRPARDWPPSRAGVETPPT
ncbi:MAG: EAL domain-containing protein, partial [Lysobacteraceae bacterium]